jgi:hypothetical protein
MIKEGRLMTRRRMIKEGRLMTRKEDDQGRQANDKEGG